MGHFENAKAIKRLIEEEIPFGTDEEVFDGKANIPAIDIELDLKESEKMGILNKELERILERFSEIDYAIRHYEFLPSRIKAERIRVVLIPSEFKTAGRSLVLKYDSDSGVLTSSLSGKEKSVVLDPKDMQGKVFSHLYDNPDRYIPYKDLCEEVNIPYGKGLTETPKNKLAQVIKAIKKKLSEVGVQTDSIRNNNGYGLFLNL